MNLIDAIDCSFSLHPSHCTHFLFAAQVSDCVLGPDSSVSIGECRNTLLGKLFILLLSHYHDLEDANLDSTSDFL